VTTDSTRLLKLLERRLDLLGTLTVALQESRNDFVAMDLGGMERRIAEQEQHCARIRSLDSEISSLQAHYAGRAKSLDGDANNDEQIRVTLARISAAQCELKRANDAHQAMLRRSRRTVQVLLNVFNSFAPTYSAPPSVGSTYEERV
jgi:FlgN protein